MHALKWLIVFLVGIINSIDSLIAKDSSHCFVIVDSLHCLVQIDDILMDTDYIEV